MWTIGIGIGELALLILVTGVLAVSGKRARRWMMGLVSCAAIGMAASPADPLSMILLAVPLMLAFGCGVFAARFIAASPEVAKEKSPRA